jgi:hypothetical protein
MVGMTLVGIREHIEALASDDGEYYIARGRTGDLCPCLLESTATELDDRSDVPERATVLEDAATRLEPAGTTATPLTATLAFVLAETVEPIGLASVPVGSEG